MFHTNLSNNFQNVIERNKLGHLVRVLIEKKRWICLKTNNENLGHEIDGFKISVT